MDLFWILPITDDGHAESDRLTVWPSGRQMRSSIGAASAIGKMTNTLIDRSMDRHAITPSTL